MRYIWEIWETSGRSLEAILETSGSRLGDGWPGEAQAGSGQKACNSRSKKLYKLPGATVSRRRDQSKGHRLRCLPAKVERTVAR